MGKNNKKRKNQYREEWDDRKDFGYSERPEKKFKKKSSDDESTPDTTNKFNNGGKPQREPVEYHPVAILLRDEMVAQINQFLDSDPGDYQTAVKDLFQLGSYPARLKGCDEAADYEAFQLDRTVRLNRDEPEKLNRLSTIIVIMSRVTHKPAFLVQAFISPNKSARVIVHEQDEKGTIYRNTLRWSNNQQG